MRAARCTWECRIAGLGREIDSPNGPTLRTPQKPPSAAHLLEDFHRRVATLETHHGNLNGPVHHGVSLVPKRATCPAEAKTEQVGSAPHIRWGQRDAPASIGTPASRGTDVAPAMPAADVQKAQKNLNQRRERVRPPASERRLKSGEAGISATSHVELKRENENPSVRATTQGKGHGEHPQ